MMEGVWVGGTRVCVTGYIFLFFSHFSDIFYTRYFHFLCISRYVFHFFYYVYSDTYGQFPYLILSWLSYRSKPISPSFYFLSLFSQITHSGTRQTKLLQLGITDQDNKGATNKDLSTRRLTLM